MRTNSERSLLQQSLQLLFCLILILNFGVRSGVAQSPKTKHVLSQSAAQFQEEEQFSFLLKDFKLDHQGEVQDLNIRVTMRYSKGIRETDYPDFREVAKTIEDKLHNYPNHTDYWEVVNKRLGALVLGKYPTLDRIAIAIEVSPTPNVPFSRSSLISVSRTQRATR